MEMDATVQTNATEQEVPRLRGRKHSDCFREPRRHLTVIVLLFNLEISNSLFVMCHVYISVTKPDVIVHLEE